MSAGVPWRMWMPWSSDEACAACAQALLAHLHGSQLAGTGGIGV